MIARRLRIHGRVQGVWYRDWTVKTARALELTGWVRNRGDGSVEVLANGEAGAVQRLIAACQEGSPRSRVDRLDVEEAQVERFDGFEQHRDH